jgi:hypothetical protein
MEYREWTGQINLPNIYRLFLVESRLISYEMGRAIFPLNLTDTKIISGNGEMIIQAKNGKVGPHYSYTVKALIPGMDLLFSRGLSYAINTKWTLLVQDFDNCTYVLGPVSRMELGGTLNSSLKQQEVIWTGLTKNIFTTDNIYGMKNKVIDLRSYDSRDIIIYRGDTLTLDLQWPDETGTPESLTGSTFSCIVRAATGVTILEFSMESGFELAEDGYKLIMSKSATETKDLIPGRYYYDLQKTNGGKVETKLRGKFIVEGDIS